MPRAQQCGVTEHRYDELGILGMGGMGAVMPGPFVEKSGCAQNNATRSSKPKAHGSLSTSEPHAQLQHPGIVPVHDIGSQPDGTLHFTMRELAGQITP